MKILVLSSGGINSAFCAEIAAKETDGDVVHLFIDHHQPQVEQERTAARALAEYYRVPSYEVVTAIQSGNDWPCFKLSTFLMLGLYYAKHSNCDYVYYGVTEEEGEPQWGGETNERTLDYSKTLKLLVQEVQPMYDEHGMHKRLVDIAAPVLLLNWQKLTQLAIERNVQLEMTWSCESPTNSGRQCGKCSKCKRRSSILKLAADRSGRLYR